MRRAAAETDLDSPPGKAAFFAALLPTLVRVDNAVERAAWLARAVERGRLDERAAGEELRRALQGRGTDAAGIAAAARRAPVSRAAGLLPAERWLIALLARGAEGAKEAIAELGEADLDGLRGAPLLRAAKTIWRRGGAMTVTALQEAAPDDDSRRLLSEIAVEGVPEDALSAQECVRELRRQPLRTRMAEIQKRLSAANGEAQDALLAEKMRLRRQMADI
jgi:hypothetical protein